MNDYLDTGADRREVPVTKNIPWLIYVSADTIHRYVKEFEETTFKKGMLFGSSATMFSLLITLVTASEFKDFAGLSGAVWHAFFVMAFLISVLFVLFSVISLFFGKRPSSVDDVVQKIAGLHEDQKEVKPASFKPF